MKKIWLILSLLIGFVIFSNPVASFSNSPPGIEMIKMLQDQTSPMVMPAMDTIPVVIHSNSAWFEEEPFIGPGIVGSPLVNYPCCIIKLDARERPAMNKKYEELGYSMQLRCGENFLS